MSNSRNLAFKILLKTEQDNAYSNLALNNAIKENNLSKLDASFVSALVYGVIERKLTLDYIIKQYSKIPLRKIELKTKIILRMGILQLLFMDKIPESAAVNESVILAKSQRLQKSSGFVNGILRNITRAEVKYNLPDKSNKVYYLSIKYSCPQDLIKLWINSYGENNTVKLLDNLNGRPKISARVNTLKISREELISELQKENVIASVCNICDNAIYLEKTGSIENLSSYKKGLFHIEDISSQICVDILNAQPHDTVLDVCSAPGGKAFTIAEKMGDRGKIFACDMYEHKLKLITAGAYRLHINSIKTILRDASLDDVKLPLADKVLCDVPCSGLGVLSRKPEIRYKSDLIDNNLPQLQYEILCKSASLLANGGVLVYSTCTLNPKENNENIRRFLEEHKDYSPMEIKLPDGIKRAFDEQPNELTLMPHTVGTDGFFVSAVRKKV